MAVNATRSNAFQIGESQEKMFRCSDAPVGLILSCCLSIFWVFFLKPAMLPVPSIELRRFLGSLFLLAGAPFVDPSTAPVSARAIWDDETKEIVVVLNGECLVSNSTNRFVAS